MCAARWDLPVSLNNAILLAALLVAAAAAGFLFYDYSNRPEPAAHQGSAVRTLLKRPEFSLPDLDGQVRHIDEWDGQATIVNFWATWCPPCRREIPLLIEFQEQAAANNIAIIGIAMDRMEDVQRYAAETNFNYAVLVGEQEAVDAAEGYGVEVVGLPLTIFANSQGEVVEIHAGELSRADLEAAMSRLVALRPQPTVRQDAPGRRDPAAQHEEN